ncbi:MAG: hypothetical protein A2060_05110 [Planctomycetes bacterium GWA2_50_13]|nr:MAG: hypothetical protein A2060_05110 [Planctomycetes bacterium GWA2_50_13]HCN19418.1 hypothetical protein [Planctomycetia bacterium]
MNKKAPKETTSDIARISLIAGDNFFDIAQVKAEGREENQIKAIEAYKRSLSFYTFKDHPYDYATTQNNLGNAYGNLAGVRDKEKNLGLAIDAYRDALKVHTLEAFPTDYATIQNNLGNAYKSFSSVRDPEKNLKLAIKAYNEALRVCTLEAFPVNYAETKFNVGLFYLDKAEMYAEKGDTARVKESLKESEEAFTESLKVFKKENMKDLTERAEKMLAVVRNRLSQIK